HMEMDLGLDSLGKIAMQCFIQENYGVNVTERDFETYQNLRSFSAFVEKNRDTALEGALKKVSWADIINSSANIELNKPHIFHFATISAIKNLTKLLYKVEYVGMDNIPENTPVIIAPNHQSYIDGVLAVGTLSKTQLYKTYFFAKIRSYINGWFRKFVDKSNVIIMDINDNVKNSIGKLAKALKEDNSVVIFPEGTRTKDGDIAEFKSTFAIISKEMKIPVIPVCISGAFENIKVGKTLPAFGSKIKVQFLRQMLPEETDTYESFANKVRNEIETVLNKERNV
ncbi:MAG: 1-acyl-sn-glycerol-3-phosphate acyltransferase, partial [Opitutales bacterium]|nr:1-acyl-sn-glycerol-3-phosphate acyltransferase [Opitutales bacterium]